MARRTRRQRVIWLPPNDSANVGEGQLNGTHELLISTAGVAGDETVAEIPLTIDGSFDATDPDVSLSDLFNSGYRLRRIVGKLWASCLQIPEETAEAVQVTAGIIVRREDPSTGASMASAFGARDISPTQVENYSDPWIWRRAWILQNHASTVVNGFFSEGAESNYGGYGGGNSDASHVDQKTARIVSSEERLFLDVSVMLLRASTIATSVRIWADFRILASLMTTSGNRRNASR